MTSQFLTGGLEKEAASSVLVDWHIIAAWIETEGSIDSTINSRKRVKGLSPFINRSIRIMQKHREALDALSTFLRTQGVRSTIRHVKPSRSSYGRTPYFSLNILSAKDMDVVIGNTAQFFITFKARRQVERFTRFRHSTAVELRSILQKKSSRHSSCIKFRTTSFFVHSSLLAGSRWLTWTLLSSACWRGSAALSGR